MFGQDISPLLEQRVEKWQSFFHGVAVSTPVVVGYLAISVAYGILARQAGLGLVETVLMSTLVYAGSAQFIGVGMLAGGASAAAIIATTFLVNLRHLLYSASLAPYLRRVGMARLAGLGFGVTDETFSLDIVELSRGPRSTMFLAGVHLAPYLAWNTGSLLGGLLGGLVGGIQQLGLDFALPAMFIALLVPQVKDRLLAVTALVSGLISLILSLFVQSSWNVLLATLLAASFGMGWKKWRNHCG